MPNTVTTFHDFVPGTPARANQVDENFSNYRGTILPINTDTASSSNLTHNLGKSSKRWNTLYSGAVDLRSTSTVNAIQIRSNTTGSLLIDFSGTTVFQADTTGFDGGYLQPESVDTSTAFAPGVLPNYQFRDFDANGSFTVPSGITKIMVIGVGGGGGGGGGAGGTLKGGGGGGSGAIPGIIVLSVTASSVFSVTVSDGGNAGQGGSLGAGTAGGDGGSAFFGQFEFLGAPGGPGGSNTTVQGSASWRAAGSYDAGGAGRVGNIGGDGGSSNWGTGGDGGINTGTDGGGGGGGAGYGIDTGGAGGNGGATGANGSDGARGGGGGGGGGSSTGNGTTGGIGGKAFVRVVWVGPNSSTV